jgi:hypothetical protein
MTTHQLAYDERMYIQTFQIFLQVLFTRPWKECDGLMGDVSHCSGKSDDLEKEFQKRLLFKLRSLKTGMLISSEILKTNQIDSNEPVFMINRVVKRVVLIIKMRTFPS